MELIANIKYNLILILLSLMILPITVLGEDRIDDGDALEGVKETKAIYDFRINKPAKLTFFLEVIEKTFNDLVRQGQNPEFVIAFRGATVRLITSENWSFSEGEQKELEKSALLIKHLHGRGVKFEACSIAAGLFKVDRNSYLPEINPVGNTFVSLIGYQAKGYGIVPVN
jgi:intracellular sulfur oxidation DsrE/DsrF family protein